MYMIPHRSVQFMYLGLCNRLLGYECMPKAITLRWVWYHYLNAHASLRYSNSETKTRYTNHFETMILKAFIKQEPSHTLNWSQTYNWFSSTLPLQSYRDTDTKHRIVPTWVFLSIQFCFHRHWWHSTKFDFKLLYKVCKSQKDCYLTAMNALRKLKAFASTRLPHRKTVHYNIIANENDVIAKINIT